MANKIGFNVFIGVLLFVFSTLASADATVSFNDESIKSRIGNTFTLDVLMSDFPTTEGGGLVLNYDSALLQVNSVVVDSSVWGFVNRVGDTDNVRGQVSGILFSSFQGVTGDAKIATIEFQAINRGRGIIRLEKSVENPFASNGQNIDVTLMPTRIGIHR
jgi:hypothetical protein